MRGLLQDVFVNQTHGAGATCKSSIGMSNSKCDWLISFKSNTKYLLVIYTLYIIIRQLNMKYRLYYS